ncbi:MAG: cyclic nucleotide-binding domain-containing protein [Rhodospirillales bacterium]|nr:cyclic nucleotide-binding domain-containing protein [Rhodospirillales bacterium]
MHRVTVAVGDTVYTEGELGVDAFLVLAGELAMSRQGLDLTAEAGAVIGLSALVNKPYGATARAVKQSDLLAFTRRELRGMLRSDPDRALVIIDAIIDLLGQLNTARDSSGC